MAISSRVSPDCDQYLADFDLTDAPGEADLELPDLLGVVLDRVRARIEVDTAAVLLLNRPGRFLVACAARGLEAEVYQGVRIPVGAGFAGRVAASRSPVVVADLEAPDSPVINPILRASGVRSLLGVPLIEGDEVLGVLHVGTLDVRRFGADDMALLRRIADRIAVDVRVHVSRADRAASTALHRSLWPENLPSIPGLELAARYVPGGDGETGGDWYDVFTLPSGATWIVMGDVAGGGLAAALAMGRLRCALRAYAMDASGPDQLLRKLSSHVQLFDPDVMATVLCAVVAPDGGTIRISSAGHPPPVVSFHLEPPASVVDVPIDPPVGVAAGRLRHCHELALPPGAAVCIYTDGLVERRNRSIDDGLELLRGTVVAGPVEAVCAAVMAALVGSEPATDDVAVLVLRRAADLSAPLELRRPAIPSTLRQVRHAVRRWLVDAGERPDVVADLVLAVDEAVTNVIEHAYGPAGGDVDVRLGLDGTEIVATVADTGRWRAARGQNRGRGLRMMEGLVDHLSVAGGQNGTTVTLRNARRGESR